MAKLVPVGGEAEGSGLIFMVMGYWMSSVLAFCSNRPSGLEMRSRTSNVLPSAAEYMADSNVTHSPEQDQGI